MVKRYGRLLLFFPLPPPPPSSSSSLPPPPQHDTENKTEGQVTFQHQIF